VFHTVLVANRGEIAVRVIRTLRAMGVRSVAVYSDADAGARHVRDADVAIRLGSIPAAESYLSIKRILDAAARTGAQAVHPGYGFLSENAAFARACEGTGLVFVGPPAASMETMGDKIQAKAAVAAAGVPVVPGGDGDDDALAAAAAAVGYPVLLKPSAGGGGRGMRIVHCAAELPEAIAAGRREAANAFGDGALLVERLVARPRHIEIQVLADTHGNVVHLGERECSLQRRHQKIIEESPSAQLDAGARVRLGEYAVAIARAVGYTGAGTVEFLVSADTPDQVFFLEMNTRLQVEHPVTELITGLDLVEWQLRVAAGEPLGFTQGEIRLAGHAIEARVYAEDPSADFLPTGGRVLALREPTDLGVRVDSGLAVGEVVGSVYDPLLVKIIAHGQDRTGALRRLDAALAQTSILGVGTNLAFLRALLAEADVRAGTLDTGLVERLVPRGVEIPEDVLAAAALRALLALEPTGPVVDPFTLPGGWRIGEPAWTRWQLQLRGHAPVEIRTRGRAARAEFTIGDGAPVRASARWDDGDLAVTVDGITHRYVCVVDDGVVWLGRDGHSWELREQQPRDAGSQIELAGDGGAVRTPMPGTVTVVDVAEGQQVSAGTRLIVVEAMKMEHVLTAPIDGVIREVHVRPGATVQRDDVVVVVDAACAGERHTRHADATRLAREDDTPCIPS
jgi:acetyl-CoA/propionyl-CoA carboxylase biotin carboxyl carrier protein